MDQNTPGLKYEVYSILLETFKNILSQKVQFKNSKKMDVPAISALFVSEGKIKIMSPDTDRSLNLRPLTAVRDVSDKCDNHPNKCNISITRCEIMSFLSP